MNKPSLIKLLIALFVIWLICGNASAQTLKERFETAAAELNGISYFYFRDYQNLDEHDPAEKQVIDDWKKLQKVTSLQASLEELGGLMEHTDARVRVLAMLSAYRLGEKEVFLLIHQRIYDHEFTIPREELEYGPLERDPKTKELKFGKAVRILEEVTISEIAQQILNAVEYYSGNAEDAEEEKQQFAKWTKSHLFNPHWIGWYDYLRVSAQNGNAINKDAPSPQVLQLRETIRQLDSPLREWVILNFGRSKLVTEIDVTNSLKSLGEEKLLTYLEKGTRGGLDTPVGHNTLHRDTGASILRHSELVFTKKNANRLSSLDLYVVAADTDPNRASFFMQKALITKWTGENSWARGLAAAVILKHQGDQEIGTILGLLYRTYNADHFDGFDSFSKEVIIREPKQWRRTFIAIANHPKFKELSPTDVKHLDKAVAHLSGAKVLKEEDKEMPGRKMKILIK